ncbi:hypothetical protein Hanom_Chr16g01494361 [Helianthus anomalus]
MVLRHLVFSHSLMLYPTGKSSSTNGGGESNIRLHDMLPLCLKIDFLNMNFNGQTNSKRNFRV